MRSAASTNAYLNRVLTAAETDPSVSQQFLRINTRRPDGLAQVFHEDGVSADGLREQSFTVRTRILDSWSNQVHPAASAEHCAVE